MAACLTDKRQELTDLVNSLEQQVVLKDDCSLADAADAASLQEGRLRACGLIEQHQQIIREIDAALRRMKSGHYGISEITGEPISYGRLKLIPWARTNADDRE